MVECDGCGSEPVGGTVTVSCDGSDFTPPPSSVSEDTSVEIIGGTPSPSPAGATEATSSADRRAFPRGSWRGAGALAALVAAVVALVV